MNQTGLDVAARETEIDAIKQLVATVEHAQNDELPDEPGHQHRTSSTHRRAGRSAGQHNRTAFPTAAGVDSHTVLGRRPAA